MTNDSQTEIQLRIDAVRTIEFNVRQFSNDETSNEGEASFEITFGLQPLNITTGILPVIVSIKYRLEGTTNPIASVSIACNFHIKNLDNLKKDDKYFMPRDLFEFLVKETYATARGALVIQSAGTVIEDFVLPLMEPSDFNITKGIMFELESQSVEQ